MAKNTHGPELSPQEVQALLQLLLRVNLTGAEAPAVVQLQAKLQSYLQDNPVQVDEEEPAKEDK